MRALLFIVVLLAEFAYLNAPFNQELTHEQHVPAENAPNDPNVGTFNLYAT